MTEKPKVLIGRVENLSFPKIGVFNVPAKIDTGAKTSSIWVSNLKINDDGSLSFVLFGSRSPYFSNTKLTVTSYTETIVMSSNGISEKRYKVKLPVEIAGRRIRASFTLADRSKHTYPILVGRNILRGKFIVDVKKGDPLWDEEKSFSQKLQSSNQKGGK